MSSFLFFFCFTFCKKCSKFDDGDCHFTLGCIYDDGDKTCKECSSFGSKSLPERVGCKTNAKGKIITNSCASFGKFIRSQNIEKDEVSKICKRSGCFYTKNACSFEIWILVVILIFIVVVIAVVIFACVFFHWKKRKSETGLKSRPTDDTFKNPGGYQTQSIVQKQNSYTGLPEVAKQKEHNQKKKEVEKGEKAEKEEEEIEEEIEEEVEEELPAATVLPHVYPGMERQIQPQVRIKPMEIQLQKPIVLNVGMGRLGRSLKRISGRESVDMGFGYSMQNFQLGPPVPGLQPEPPVPMAGVNTPLNTPLMSLADQ